MSDPTTEAKEVQAWLDGVASDWKQDAYAAGYVAALAAVRERVEGLRHSTAPNYIEWTPPVVEKAAVLAILDEIAIEGG